MCLKDVFKGSVYVLSLVFLHRPRSRGGVRVELKVFQYSIDIDIDRYRYR